MCKVKETSEKITLNSNWSCWGDKISIAQHETRVIYTVGGFLSNFHFEFLAYICHTGAGCIKTWLKLTAVRVNYRSR
jgi:hypothetical protein